MRKNCNPQILTEQRPWGSFDLFMRNEKSTVKLLHVKRGKRLSLQYHSKRSELWNVVVGKIGVTLGSSTIILNKGEGITIPVGAIHRIKGIEDSTILEIAVGEFDETDIIRLADDFGRSGTRARRNQINDKAQSSVTQSQNNSHVQSQVSGRTDSDQELISNMIRNCKEEEEMEHRLEILRKINALLPDKRRLNIPSLIIVHYIDYALSDIEDRISLAL